MSFDVTVQHDLKKLKRQLNDLETKVAPQAAIRTLNRVAESAKVASARHIAPQMNSRQAAVTAWYLLADPNRFDTIEVGYLDGVAAPFLDQQEGWTIDGVEYKVRIDAAAAPLEFRTMYKNAGT